MNDDDILEEDCPSEFCSESIRDKQKTNFTKAAIHILAGEAGLETECKTEAARLKYELRGLAAGIVIFKNYGMPTLHKGSVKNPTNLPRFFGSDSPYPDADRATIANMRRDRGQGLDDDE